MRVTETRGEPPVLPSRCEHKAVRGLRCVFCLSLGFNSNMMLLVYKQWRCVFHTSRSQEVHC